MPIPLQNWPAPHFDDEMINSVTRAMDVQSEAGFSHIDTWGLFATYGYPPDIESVFTEEEHTSKVRELLKAAAKRDMHFMFGFGLFSWGYDEIIEADPPVRGVDHTGNPHPHAMCGAKEKSWTYVEKNTGLCPE